MRPEENGLLISLGIIITGRYVIKPKNKDIGNMVQGIGLGTGVGTIAHLIDAALGHDPLIPHHDIIGLVGIPTVFILDKTDVIKNKDTVNILMGMSLGLLSQHLLTESCSFCGTYYCSKGEKLC